jgi:hypothetical protein
MEFNSKTFLKFNSLSKLQSSYYIVESNNIQFDFSFKGILLYLQLVQM